MLRYTLRRLWQSAVTVFIVITVVFLLMRLLPVEGYFEENYDKLDPDQRENILRSLGLLDPWYVQLRTFYSSLLRGTWVNPLCTAPKWRLPPFWQAKCLTPCGLVLLPCAYR